MDSGARFRQSFRAKDSADLTEIGLLRRALPLIEAFEGRLPLGRELADINEHFGVEIAQTVFAQCLERIPNYGEFIRRVRSFNLGATTRIREAASRFEVTIVSSSFSGDRESAARADQWRTWARSMGFTTDVIETDPFGDQRTNAQIISSHLLSHSHPRRILITHGPGAAEFRHLLLMRMGLRGEAALGSDTSPVGELASIKVWLNIEGAYRGASHARLINDSLWQKIKREVSVYLGDSSFGERARRLRQLDPRLALWKSDPVFPEGLQVINLIGLPLRSDLRGSMMVAYETLSREVGPNDGAVSLFESIAHPGLILPVPGLSHAAEAAKLEPVLRRVLAIAALDLSASVALRNAQLSTRTASVVL